jgi:thiamine pyrophosphokinase
MSSHHIVREKQEPALLVLGLDNFSNELLGQLLEWSPTVITTIQTAEKLTTYGIKIDWMISSEAGEVLQSDVKRLDPGNDTVLHAVLKTLVDQSYSSVNIVTDILQLEDYAHFIGLINIVIFYDGKKIYAITPGFTKWKPAGETIEILTPCNNPQASGLKAAGHQRYTTISDGFFNLDFKEPFIFIAEDL